jgi:hypothetical protein
VFSPLVELELLEPAPPQAAAKNPAAKSAPLTSILYLDLTIDIIFPLLLALVANIFS